MYVLSKRVNSIALPVFPSFIPAGFLKSISTLTNPKQRDEWEKCFNKTYIQPVLSNLDKYIQMTMKGIMEDSEKGMYDLCKPFNQLILHFYFHQEHNPLFYMVYDESDTFDDDGDAYLWSYRSRITFDHLAIQLQPHKEKYRILTKFIEQVHLEKGICVANIEVIHVGTNSESYTVSC